MSNPVLIHCHLPKAAGTSLTLMAASIYKEQCVVIHREPEAPPMSKGLYPLLRQYWQYARFIEAQTLRAVDDAGLWPETRFITVLRDPVERFFSWYYFQKEVLRKGLMLSYSQENLGREVDARFPSIDEMLLTQSNFMTAFYAWLPFGSEMTSKDLEVAKRELKNYDYVLTTEILDLLKIVLQDEFPELAAAELPVANTSKTRRPEQKWSEIVEGAIYNDVSEKMHLDLDLYEFGVSLIHQKYGV